MNLTSPTLLTLLRIALVPVLVLFFYLPFAWSNQACAVVFVLAAVTDWADGYLARRMGQMSRFGAFLDPVADKIMVATALILLVQRQETFAAIFALAAAVIIGREITISALREWLSEVGGRALVNVSWVGKLKTGFQMTAIGFLLYHDPMGWIPIALIGELLLYTAAALTLWSMWIYLQAAWPIISDSRHHEHYAQGENSASAKAPDAPGGEAD
ncbi:MAG TPA: CDP-diacylglycerol--glycerol-3-phosphate 3-phosphatidyltransferase [Xanthomonadales bacterium]|nr:CDP-diacylglycerol--glycerol-3-phosphate 3-phosphatidyltransferase [Xanthomonadales bacterium]